MLIRQPAYATWRLAALAAIAFFAVALSAAPASAMDASGQQRTGVATPAPAVVTTAGGSVSVPGAGTATYLDWQPALGTNASSAPTPHGDFSTTTMKCAVCHSVHYAGGSGAPVVDPAAQADTLLRMPAADACFFCHCISGQAVNGMPVDSGSATDTVPGHYSYPGGCQSCHTSIHGDPMDTSVASLSGYLLRTLPVLDVGSKHTYTGNMLDVVKVIDEDAVAHGFAPGAALGGTVEEFEAVDSPDLRDRAVGVFCAQCHAGSYSTVAPGASANASGSAAGSFTGHRIGATATADWNADKSKSKSATFSGQIAWQPSWKCTSCHDAKDRFGQLAFPHSWGGSGMWLTGAKDAGSAETTLPLNCSRDATDAAQISDAVCMRCHVSSDGTAGIGITF